MFSFKDTNSKMYQEEKIKLTNKGNSAAYFEFPFPEGCIFSYVSEHKFVPKRSSIDAVFRYTPKAK